MEILNGAPWEIKGINVPGVEVNLPSITERTFLISVLGSKMGLISLLLLVRKVKIYRKKKNSGKKQWRWNKSNFRENRQG